MNGRGERLIALKRGLSERELRILAIELDRRRKSTGVAYFLWFFLSWLGVHKFYLGRIASGVLYVFAPWLAIFMTLSGGAMAAGEVGAGAPTALLGLLALFAYGVWWFVDLFTIPRQTAECNEGVELEIIASLNAGKEARGLSPNPTLPE